MLHPQYFLFTLFVLHQNLCLTVRATIRFFVLYACLLLDLVYVKVCFGNNSSFNDTIFLIGSMLGLPNKYPWKSW